jgi:hypothetical protein
MNLPTGSEVELLIRGGCSDDGDNPDDEEDSPLFYDND